MLLQREEVERMRAAIEQNLVQAVETLQGECIAVDDETGQEWGHKWRGGEARVYVENDPDDADEEEDGPSVDYVFAVRVVLVAVEAV
jgi:hypothetical protein